MRKQDGFTLIEIIAALVVLGLLFAGLGSLLVLGTQSYIFSSDNSRVSLQAQNALARITIELQNATAITAITPNTSITYTVTHPTLGNVTRVLARSGTTLTITTAGVTKQVASGVQTFTISRLTGNLDGVAGTNEVQAVVISIDYGQNRTFATRVYPRRLLPAV